MIRWESFSSEPEGQIDDGHNEAETPMVNTVNGISRISSRSSGTPESPGTITLENGRSARCA